MSFQSFAENHGLLVGRLVADGRWHRVPTVDHPKKRNGAYRFDGASGWVQNWSLHDKAIVYQPDGSDPAMSSEERQRLMRLRAADRAKTEAKARKQAAEILACAEWKPHPYLERKGFPQECGMVHESRLIIPMWDYEAYGKTLNSAQRIDADGAKKFLFGGKAKGSIYRLGSGPELWHCEGYATALSIQAALKKLYRRASIVVCFSAANLAYVAKALGGRIVADNDESGTGQRAAIESGLPWCMPPVVGADANDMHRVEGVSSVIEMLRGAL